MSGKMAKIKYIVASADTIWIIGSIAAKRAHEQIFSAIEVDFYGPLKPSHSNLVYIITGNMCVQSLCDFASMPTHGCNENCRFH
jgi:hypothetical protein